MVNFSWYNDSHVCYISLGFQSASICKLALNKVQLRLTGMLLVVQVFGPIIELIKIWPVVQDGNSGLTKVITIN